MRRGATRPALAWQPVNVSTGDVLYGALDATGGDGYAIVSSVKGEQVQSVLRANDHSPQVRADALPAETR